LVLRITAKIAWADIAITDTLPLSSYNLVTRIAKLLALRVANRPAWYPAGRQPWYFTARDGSPILTAAGLWDEWKNRETGERLKSCTMIIIEPNDMTAQIHDRMPAFLTERQFAPWLSGEAGAGMLKPTPNDYLQRWPVSKRVNSSKADAEDATLIDKVELAVP
jgi:putative SOS response-associated peptidase YedK